MQEWVMCPLCGYGEKLGIEAARELEAAIGDRILKIQARPRHSTQAISELENIRNVLLNQEERRVSKPAQKPVSSPARKVIDPLLE